MKSNDNCLKTALKSGLTTDKLRYAQERNKVTQILCNKGNFFVRIVENAKKFGNK